MPVLETRPHVAVLALPLTKAVLLAGLGGFLATRPWPLLVASVVLLAAAAWTALRAVWRWERTRLVISPGGVVLVWGTLRRRTASVLLDAAPVELEQSLVGRLLRYGTIVAGDVEIPYVPEPQRVFALATGARAADARPSPRHA